MGKNLGGGGVPKDPLDRIELINNVIHNCNKEKHPLFMRFIGINS